MKMRLVGWHVRPVVMADDGEHLSPVEVSGHMVSARDWDAFKAGGDSEALDLVRKQVENADRSR